MLLEYNSQGDQFLAAAGLTYWDTAVIAFCIVLLASVRRHAAAWRKELDGEQSPDASQTVFG
ncbi:hypothetical protein [Brevundimonas sp.]|uniref:hypothetical protein n=1 Tax=Brevundimonas sp. TaxID=1871086 RepID=UPI0025ECB65E|nr:hypothetical protein [Brevundimonas sp.]